jgi:RNA polymerase sigma factor (sigma-70 family)
MSRIKKSPTLSKEQQAGDWKTYSILVNALRDKGRSFNLDSVRWYEAKYPEHRSLVRTALKARERLIFNNEGFIVVTARKYDRPGVLVDDLIQVGREACIYALSKYDPSKGTKFSSYAALWIRSRIAEAVKKSPLVHVPAYSGIKQYRFISHALLPSDDLVPVYDLATDGEPGLLDEVMGVITESEREILERSFQNDALALDLWGERAESERIIEKVQERLAVRTT